MDIAKSLLPYVLAGIIASIISFFGLMTEKFPRTYFLIINPRNSLYPYVYSTVYGAAAFVTAALITELIKNKTLQIDGLYLQSTWARSIYIGVATRSFLNISLFSIGDKSVGMKSLVDIIEPRILKQVLLDEHDALSRYISPAMKKHNGNLRTLKSKAIKDIPEDLFDDKEFAAIKASIMSTETSRMVFIRYLKTMGKKNYERLFH